MATSVCIASTGWKDAPVLSDQENQRSRGRNVRNETETEAEADANRGWLIQLLRSRLNAQEAPDLASYARLQWRVILTSK